MKQPAFQTPEELRRRRLVRAAVIVIAASIVTALLLHMDLSPSGRELAESFAGSEDPESSAYPCDSAADDLDPYPGLPSQACPDGSAFFSVDDAKNRQGVEPRAVRVSGACCRLPDGALTSDHLYAVTDECPEGYIVTSRTSPGCEDYCVVRCTKVDRSRFTLGPPLPAVRWIRSGVSIGRRFLDMRAVRWERIPEGIRLSVGRIRGNHYDDDGCIGWPVGSLLSGKVDGHCDGYRFRQLRHPDGSPVRTFASVSKPSEEVSISLRK